MDGVLNYDAPQGPTSKAEIKTNEQNLLKAMRQEAALRAKKAQLIEAIRNTEEEIAEEKERKRVLQTQARDLRVRMERLAVLAPDLVKEKERQEEHIKHVGLEKYPPDITRKGPSSSRTGFVRDYKGKLYLGGSDEGRKSETQMYKLAQKEVERRRSEARREALRRTSGSSRDVGDGNSSTTTATSPTSPLPSIKIRNSKRVVENAPHLQKETIYGKSSQLDLDKAKYLSSKRSRYYTDYEGRRIAMDPSDWPTTDGLLLL